MATNQEIPITDTELDDLMAELENETKDMVVAPVVSAAPVTVVEEPDETLAALEAELEAAEAEPVVAVVKPAAVKPAAVKPAAVAKVIPDITPEPKTAVEADYASVKLHGAEALEAAAQKLAEETPTKAVVTPVARANPVKPATLGHYIDMGKFSDEIRISPSNIDTAMMEQASLLAFHAEESARAEAQSSRLKLRFEIVEAALYDKHRKALLAAGEKTTEKMVENAVKLDPEYVASKNRVIEGEFIAATRKACVASMRDRKDMLVQIGADRREEGKGQLRMLEQDLGHADAKARALRAAA